MIADNLPDAARVTFAGVDGVTLVGDSYGNPHAPPVIFLHGGGQTRQSWGKAAAAVADRGWHALSLDARGHGESDWAPTGDYRLWSFARDVQAVISDLAERPMLVGASLGGLTTMLLAGELAPGIAQAALLVDIVPDMEQDGAMRIQAFMIDRATEGFESLEEVADAVAAYNPHRPRPSDLNGLRKNLRHRDGRWYWHWDPRFMGGPGLPPSEVNDVDRLTSAVRRIVSDGVPLMLVRGAVSDLVTEAKAEEFLAEFPQADYADVSGAGHMVAGDRNDAFIDAVVGFLERHR